MDTQEAKEAGFTPMQSMQVKIDKLESGFAWLKWSLLAGFAAIGLCFTAVFFTIRDTKQDIKQDMQRLDSRIDRIESKLDLLIQKQTSQQEAKQSPAKRQAKR